MNTKEFIEYLKNTEVVGKYADDYSTLI